MHNNNNKCTILILGDYVIVGTVIIRNTPLSMAKYCFRFSTMSLNVSNIAPEEAITFRSDHRASLHPNKMNAGGGDWHWHDPQSGRPAGLVV